MIWSRLHSFLSASALVSRIGSPRTLRSGAVAIGFVFCSSKMQPLVASSCAATLSSCSEGEHGPLGYLDASSAFSLDQELMSSPGFCLEQLMELAGLSVAEAVHEVAPQPNCGILIVCGPGNNGGDGLVAARHLHHFGFRVTVVYPKNTSAKQPHYGNLVQQCHDLTIPVLTEMPDTIGDYAVIVDSIFGFSFRGEPRPPFDSILKIIQGATDAVTVAVDVPSGWSVDGDDNERLWMPTVLVSLTAPKLCSKNFKGRHFVGGRFLPPALAEKYQIRMPQYLGVRQVVEVTNLSVTQKSGKHNHATTDTAKEDNSWELEYAAYCAQKETAQASETTVPPARDSEAKNSWEIEYAAYCAEKEVALKQKNDN